MLAKPIIAVAGATSKQGRSVVKSLLHTGDFHVRALSRNPASAQAQQLARAGAEVVSAPLALGYEAMWRDAFYGATGAFLITPPVPPRDSWEYELGCLLADAAVAAGVKQVVFSTLENVQQISNGRLFAPHFTDKALVADYIRTLDVQSSFIMLAFFYTNLLEYYVPRKEGDTLVFPIYLPEDFQAPFVDPLTATGPVVAEIFSHFDLYEAKTVPVVGDMISPREMVAVFSEVTGIAAEYRDAFSREGLLYHYPEFGADTLQVAELLGMVNYAVDYGYFQPGHDLAWSQRIVPEMLTWRQFLNATGWRGTKMRFDSR